MQTSRMVIDFYRARLLTPGATVCCIVLVVVVLGLLLPALAQAAPVMVVDSAPPVSGEVLDGWQLDGDGWLDTASMTFADTYYVSSSIGSDSYDGTSGTVDGGGIGPKATISAGLALMTNGEGDRLLLKRGDDWESEGAIETSITGGTSKSSPMLLGAYGSGDKPIVHSINLTGASESEEFLVVQDIHFVWTATGFSGDQFWENCWFGGTDAEDNLNGISYFGYNTVVTRCLFDWHRSTGTYSSQGFYFERDMLRVRKSYFWGNRDFERPEEWAEAANQHAIYCQTNATDVIIDNCVVWELIDNGLYIRGSGTVTDSLAYRTYAGAGSIGHLFHWDTAAPGGVTGLSARNVNLQSLMHFNNAATSGLVVEDNIVVGPNAEYGIQVGGVSRGGTFSDNIVYLGAFRLTSGTQYSNTGNTLWRDSSPAYARALYQSTGDGTVWSGTTFFSSSSDPSFIYYLSSAYSNVGTWESASGATGSTYGDPDFVDPSRDMESYLEDVYGQGNIYADEEEAWDGFLTLVRAQDRGNWDTDLEAETINAYIRAGFEVSE